MKFLSPEVALYFYKYTIRPCMKYWCHLWAGAPSRYLEFLDNLQKRMCRIAGHSLASSLEPLAHRRNVASLNLFYRYYFGRCSSELAQLVPLPFSRGRSTRYSDRLHGFSVTIPRCYNDVYVNSFCPRTARFWNSLPIEFFLLTYDLKSFKSKINRHLLTVGFSKEIPVRFNLFVLLFFVTPCFVVAVKPCMEWIPIKIAWWCLHFRPSDEGHYNLKLHTLGYK